MNDESVLFLALFAIAWILCLSWSALFGLLMRKYPKIERLRDSGLALLSLAGGLCLIGGTTNGFEKEIGIFAIAIWAIGSGSIALSSLTISNGVCNGSWKPFG